MSIEIKLINLDIVGSIPVFELSFFFNLKCTVWSTVVFHIDIGFKVCAKKIDFKVIPLMDYIITLVGSHESYKFLLINSNKFTNNSIFFYISNYFIFQQIALYFFLIY